MKELIAGIASVLAIAGNVPYLHDVITKKIQPHPYTWLVWSVVSGVTLAGQILKGGGAGAMPVAISEGFTVIIFLYALRYGFRDIQRKDTYALFAALLGLIPWALTKDPTISVVIVVCIDAVAFVPAFRKTWHHPKSETPLLYSMNVLRHILILFSLGSYNIATTFHSIVMIVLNSLMTFFIVRHDHKSVDEAHTEVERY